MGEELRPQEKMRGQMQADQRWKYGADDVGACVHRDVLLEILGWTCAAHLPIQIQNAGHSMGIFYGSQQEIAGKYQDLLARGTDARMGLEPRGKAVAWPGSDTPRLTGIGKVTSLYAAKPPLGSKARLP